jgi:hypothetical protein
MFKFIGNVLVYDKNIDEKTANDGWTHVENAETTEGILKELMGMLKNDRHERVMEAFAASRLQDMMKKAAKIPVT